MGEVISLIDRVTERENEEDRLLKHKRRTDAVALLSQVSTLLSGMGETESEIALLAEECAVLLDEASWTDEDRTFLGGLSEGDLARAIGGVNDDTQARPDDAL
jgi:hypothetical protein